MQQLQQQQTAAAAATTDDAELLAARGNIQSASMQAHLKLATSQTLLRERWCFTPPFSDYGHCHMEVPKQRQADRPKHQLSCLVTVGLNIVLSARTPLQRVSAIWTTRQRVQPRGVVAFSTKQRPRSGSRSGNHQA
mgnify:CR=1 FL=1